MKTRRTTGTAKRLALGKQTLKDLETGPEGYRGLKGGVRNTANPACPPPPTVRCVAKTTVPAGCPGAGGKAIGG